MLHLRLSWPVTLALVVAAAGVNVLVATSPRTQPLPDLLLQAAKAGLLVWALAAAGALVLSLVSADGEASAVRGPRIGAVWIVGGTLVVLVAALAQTPSRLALSVLGVVVLSLALLWPVHAHAGPWVARRAALLVALLALYPLGTDLRAEEPTIHGGPALFYQWPVGWPAAGWVLRHEIVVPPQGALGRAFLVARLAEGYGGMGHVAASANGRSLGVMAVNADATALFAKVPDGLLLPGERLVFELRMEPPDPQLRLVAQRWSAGATLGRSASSFYDGERWHAGTLDVETAMPQPGVYLISLQAAP